MTLGDGILVIEAMNGGTTQNGAFGLSGIVAAGPYEYLLYRGGYSAGTQNNFYLRNALGPNPNPDPDPDPDPGPEPQPPIPDPQPPVPGPVPPAPVPPAPVPPGPAPIPFYRPEAVVYAGLPGLARFIGLEILGTFHERQGEQSLLTKNGGFPIAWGRAFGSKTEFRRGGPLAPEFDGHLFGFQAGMDLGAAETWQGHATISVSSSAMPRPTATCAASPSASAGRRAARCRWTRPASASTGPMSGHRAGISTAF